MQTPVNPDPSSSSGVDRGLSQQTEVRGWNPLPGNGLPLDALGRRLRMWRADRHISQAQLATLLGVTQASISHWENDHPPDHPAILVLAMRALTLELK